MTGTPGGAPDIPPELRSPFAFLEALCRTDGGTRRRVPELDDALRSTLVLSVGAARSLNADDGALAGMAAGVARGAAFVRERSERAPGLDDVFALAAHVLGRDAAPRTRVPRFGDPLIPPPDRLGAEMPRLGAALGEVAALAAARPAPDALIRAAAGAHLVFEEVHPLDDANGRVGRLLLAWQMLAGGLTPPCWQLRDRRPYVAAVRARDPGALAALAASRVGTGARSPKPESDMKDAGKTPEVVRREAP